MMMIQAQQVGGGSALCGRWSYLEVHGDGGVLEVGEVLRLVDQLRHLEATSAKHHIIMKRAHSGCVHVL